MGFEAGPEMKSWRSIAARPPIVTPGARIGG